MPVFEYVCSECGAKYSILVGMVAEPKPVECPRCGSRVANKLVSRFSKLRSEDDRLEALGDRVEAMGDEADPRTVRELAREFGDDGDEDMSEEIEQMLETEGDGEDFGVP